MEKKEINLIEDTTLEKASGGVTYGKYRLSGLVSWENCVIGQKYYIDYGGIWFTYSKLVAIYPSPSGDPNQRTLAFQNDESGATDRLSTFLIDIYTTMTIE